MPTNAMLVTWDTDTEISTDDRHALKEMTGEFTRAVLGQYGLTVAIDSLDPAEPHVAALLPPVG